MSKSSIIKAITFDLDGVYFINGKENFINNLVNLGVDKKEAVRVFFKSDVMNKQYKAGTMTDEQYWSWALNEWELDMNVEQIISLLIEGYEENADVVQTVQKVRENGYMTLVCTNNFPARINGLQKRFGFLNNFDTAVFSYEIGATKPSTEIFQALVNKAGVKAEEIIFADDNENNIKGASELGIQTFIYEDFLQFIHKIKTLGVTI